MNSPSADSTDRASELARWALVTLIALYVVLQYTHAWVVDDAYITLRTVDNFVHGLGLRWNPGERVQSYTHPLWMFVLSAAYFVTRESFYTTLAVSFVTSLVALFWVVRAAPIRAQGHRAALFLALLLGSKAFLDYSSSGLENPLTHVLLAAFFLRFLSESAPAQSDPEARRRALFYGGITALAFVNRIDTILFFAPACVYAMIEERARLKAFARGALLGATPALAWVLFAFFYYGTIVPNTAIAKLAGPRVTAHERFIAGLAYFGDSLMVDPLSLLTCGAAIAISVSARRARPMAAAGGVLLYLVYVLTTGAIGTHMSGRFFSGTVFLSALLLALQSRYAAQALGAVALMAFWMVGSPVSPLAVGSTRYGLPRVNRGGGNVIDTRDFVLQEGAALLNVVPGESMPRHDWYRAGRDYRNSPERTHVGGLVVSLAIGYSAFAAGPDKHFIDVLGLSDPLIARIPLPAGGAFRPGHFFRPMPAGYPESVDHGSNEIADPDLHAYYEAVRSITRDPLLSGARLATLWNFATGTYDERLEAFAKRNGLRTRH